MLFSQSVRKKSTTLLATLGALLAAVSVQADSVVTDPVGFVNTTIQGTGGTKDSALTFVGLSVTQPVSFQGSVGSYTGGTKVLTPTNGTFTADQFNGASGAYFVEVTSGSAAGTLSDITATTASPSSITTADDLSAKLAGGESFKIRKHWTLDSVFGPNPNTSNLVILGTGGASDADQVLLFNPVTQLYVTFYYKTTSGYGGIGWRSTTSGNPLLDDRSKTILRVTDGLLVRRKLTAPVVLSLPGAVKLGATQRSIASGLNFAGDVYASGTTLANSGLWNPANPAASLVGGGASVADQVLIYDGANYVTYYYKVGGYGGDGWRSTSGANPLVTPQDNTPLPAGYSVLILRRGAQGFVWTAPQPFTIAL